MRALGSKVYDCVYQDAIVHMITRQFHRQNVAWMNPAAEATHTIEFF